MYLKWYIWLFISVLASFPLVLSFGQLRDSTHFDVNVLLSNPYKLPTLTSSLPDSLPLIYSLEYMQSVSESSSIEFSDLPDSLRQRFVIRFVDPLDSLNNRIFAYQAMGINSFARTPVKMDTTLYRFDINNPVLRNYHVGGYLGNLGLSYYPIGFHQRERPSDFPFMDNLKIYLHDPEKTVYYQTKTPYTIIDISSAGPKLFNETVFGLVHTQNVNEKWNVGMYYDIFTSEGQYVHQRASNNGFSLFSAYRGDQYSMYSNFNWNNVRMQENGGLADLDFFTTNENESSSNAVRSTAGRTELLNRSLYVTHSYSPTRIALGKRVSVSDSIESSRIALVHTLRYEWTTREYTDTATYALRGIGKPTWWDTGFADSNTHDSLRFRRISNHIRILFREPLFTRYSSGFSVGLLSELDRYNIGMIPRPDTIKIAPNTPNGSGWGGNLPSISGEEMLVYFRQSNNHFNTALTGSFFNHTGRHLNWNINGRTYFAGYKMGDVNIDGHMQLHYFTDKGRNSLLLGGSIDNTNPGYFFNRYSSNLLVWENNFNMSQEIRLRGEFTMPHRKLKLGGYVSQLNNYLYFDNVALPRQTSELLMTATGYVEKDIRWKSLGFRFRLYGQYSSNQSIIPLPAFAGYQSTYFESWLVRNVLVMQLGVNVMYNSLYYAQAYMPATGMFHLQDDRKIGNYPFFDLFANFQLNRGRIFIKTDGFNTLLNGALGKRNFMAYRYPTNDFRMKIGMSWTFYN